MKSTQAKQVSATTGVNSATTGVNPLLERMFDEAATSFNQLSNLGPAVSVFGTARSRPGNPDYEIAREVGRLLGQAGFSVITGGGPGAMEAANRGAVEAGGTSVGVLIIAEATWEKGANEYAQVVLDHHDFFTRKLVFLEHSDAFIFMPGGFGTLDELGEVLTQIQCGTQSRKPVVLVDSSFWTPLVAFMRQQMLTRGYVGEADFDLLEVVDTASQAVAVVKAAVRK